ncbi:glycosyltransferase family 9 protein [Caulobacter mirabilis]|uniref:ADP-heptose--LPS heptosyltransferase n=1 Tax=Caulobacter mirabilis TaxID=69666 RepID=A0A2D2AUR5_9CAUL|nr:glycosyltransferase family 9 protein [Caulobacter mirabilis]ATQ41746.1 ADP-heptose--LPS heptosyltransferase [Caulobacter mirabilis]
MIARSFPILIVGPTRIGDAVLASGLVKKLADEAPGARFTIAVGPAAASLFREVPGLDELIVMEKLKGSGHWFALWNKVRHTRWGLVIDMRGSALSSFLKRDRRAVYKRPSEPTHKVIEAARLLTLEDDPPPPYLFTSPEIEAHADELVGEGGPILAIGPAANWMGKTWPIERFGRLAIELLDDEGPMAGGRLMILGGPEDVRHVEPLARTMPKDRLIDLTGQIDLLTAYACLKRARLFVGNDSGLMHLAAAAGAPTVGLFGPSDDRLYAPWGPHTRVVRGPREFEQFKQVDPDFTQAINHMMDLPVDAVVRAARELLAETEEDDEGVEAEIEEAPPADEPEADAED